MKRFHELPVIGTLIASAASSTPGTALTLATNSRLYSGRRPTGIFKGEKSKSATSTPSCCSPAFTDTKFRNVCTNSSAATSSTSESATCETTNPRLNASPRRPAVLPRPPPFIAYPGSDLAACNAGAIPHSKHVSIPSPVVNNSTRQSADSGKNRIVFAADETDQQS